MIARGFKPVGWVFAVGSAALSCYMLSLQVAAERAELTNLERRIVATRQQIRSLQTELGTRGRVQQLEQWNDEVLALSAPVAGQFVDGNVTLARFDIRPPVLADPAEVRMASAVVPPAPAPAPAARTATPAPQRAVADVRTVAPPAPLQQPLVRRASLALADHAAPAPTRPEPARAQAPATRPRAEAAPVRTASAEPRTPPAPAAAPTRPRAEPARTRTASAEARPRPAAARARSSSLLDDSTLRDLGTAARAERGGGTRN